MKTQKGIVWIPILIMVVSVAAFTTMAVLVWNKSKKQDSGFLVDLSKPAVQHVVKNANDSTNTVGENTNVAANTNIATTKNTNSNSLSNGHTSDPVDDFIKGNPDYTNLTEGISFHYPVKDIIREYSDAFGVRVMDAKDPNKDAERFTDSVGPGSIGVARFTLESDLQKFAKDQVGGNFTPTITTVAGKTAYRVTGTCSSTTCNRVSGASSSTVDYYFVNTSAATWALEFDSANTAKSPTHDEFSLIVASFQFTK